MKMLQKFSHEGISIEVINLDGKSLFNAAQVGNGLCISADAVRKALADMEAGDDYVLVTNAMLTNCSNVNSTHIRKLANRGETFLTESGVYELMIQSRRPEAKSFRRWITREVLPSIRETGSYGTPQGQLPGTYLDALKQLVSSEEEKLRLAAQNQELSAHLADAAEEKQTLLDITKPHGYIRIKDAAKIISYPGLGQNNMFKFLCKHRILMKIGRDDQSHTFYQRYEKYFKERPTEQTGGHEGMPYTQVIINMDGVSFLHRKILKVKGPWRGMKTKEELIAEFSEKEEL